MKLHLPVSLHRAVLKVLAVLALPLATTVASGAGEEPSIDERANLGKTMYVGDSITHGAYSGLYSWRWSMHKIFADNGISYTEVGVKTGNAKDAGVDMPYGDTVFHNKHSAENSARAFEIAERKQKEDSSGHVSLRFGGTGIQHWLGLGEPDVWTGDKTTDDYRLNESEKTVDTFFLLIGTNDLLSEGSVNRTAKESDLLGRTESGNSVSWSGKGDMDTIVDAMFADNEGASVVILTVPTWGAHGNNSTENDYQDVKLYNQHLKDWVAQKAPGKNIKLVDLNRGLVDVANIEKPWQGVDSFFFASDGRAGNDHVHPSAQGELIIAGNVARGLGYAGRTAGQERKPGTNFSYEHHDAGSIRANAKSKSDDVTQTGTGGLTFAAGSSMQYSWSGGVDTSGGYTVEFKLDGGLGNGSNSGWDTINGLSISVGNGKRGGCLTVNEAYIQWGNKVLFSLDTSSDLTESLRVAYVLGSSSLGLSKGFYVWLGDQLIGEALSSNVTEAPDGLSVENGTNNSITISDLYLDNAPWAPTTTGYYFSNPLIDGGGKMPEAQYEVNPGVTDEWASVDDLLNGGTTAYAMSSAVGIGGALENGRYLGATVKSTTASSVALNLFVSSSTYTYPSELYVTMDPESTAGFYADVILGSVSMEAASVRFLGGSYHNWFVVNSGSFDGPLYMEFSPEKKGDGKKADLSVAALSNWTINNSDTTYDSHEKRNSVALTTFFQGNTTPNKVAGEVRFVFNGGTFDGAIYGGNVYGASSADTVVKGGVHIYINGGTFSGNIYAGGTTGYIASSEITITGGLEAMDFTGVTRISAGGFGTGNAGGVADGGTAIVTLQNITAEDGIADYEGEISGGRKPSNFNVWRKLALKNVTTALKATLADFDEVQVEDGSTVQLKGLGGATALSVSSGSKLTLEEGKYTGMVTTNGGEIVLEGEVSYETELAKIEDDQVAWSTTGIYSIGAGSSLELGADAGGMVRGTVNVNLLAGGTYTTSLTGEESGDGSVLVTLNGGGQHTVGASVEGVTIRLHLSGMTSDSSIAAGGSHKDYAITLVGENAIELGEGMKETAFFGTTGAVSLAEGASLHIGVNSILTDLRGTETQLTYKVAGCDLTAWNEGGMVQIDREVQLSGRTSQFDKKGNLVFTVLENLYWSASAEDTTVVLGENEGEGEWSSVDGEHGTYGWVPGKNVHLNSPEATEEVTVTVADEGATMASLELLGATTYNFSTSATEDHTVTVSGGLTNNATGLSVGQHVVLDVGSYSGTGEVNLSGGTLKLGTGGTITEAVSMSGGSTLELGGAVTLDGGLSLTGEGGTATVKLGSGGKLSTSQKVTGSNVGLQLEVEEGEEGKEPRKSDSFELTGGGELKNLTGGTYVIGKLTGEWTLKEASSIGILKMGTNDTLNLTIGGDFTVNSLTQETWQNTVSLIVKNSGESAVNFILEQQYSDLGQGRNFGTFDAKTISFGEERGEEVNFVKKGDKKFAIGAATFTLYGNFTDESRETFSFYSSTVTINGLLTKSAGELVLTNDTLNLNGREGSAGKVAKLTFRGSDAQGTSSSTINLGADLVFGELDFVTQDDAHTFYGTGSVNKSGSAGGDVYLLWDCSATDGASMTFQEFIEKYGTLTLQDVGIGKAGAGTLTITEGGQLELAPLEVKEGTMTLQGQVTAKKDVRVVNGATLRAEQGLAFEGAGLLVEGVSGDEAKASTYEFASSSGTISLGAVTLKDGGVLKSAMVAGHASDKFTMAQLTVSGSGNKLDWSNAGAKGEVYQITKLTGSGELKIADVTGSDDAGEFRRVRIDNASVKENQQLTITGNMGDGTGPSFVLLGGVDVGSGGKLSVNVSGRLGALVNAQGGVFRKTGAGTLEVEQLTVSSGGTISMTHEGTMTITKLTVHGGGILAYEKSATDSGATQLFSWDWDSSLEKTGDTLTLDDITNFLNGKKWTLKLKGYDATDVSNSGFDLGITSTASGSLNADQLRDFFTVTGDLDVGNDWGLEWKENKLYLTATNPAKVNPAGWDENWGTTETEDAPSQKQLTEAIFNESKTAQGGFTANAVVLWGNETYSNGSSSYVLVTGGGGENAAIIGGKLYKEAGSAEALSGNTYIYVAPQTDGGTAEFHLLVGGSSMLQSGISGVSSFTGNTHIQVEKGGTVDYIIGGNHVNNSQLRFEGDTYISVKDGAVVNGGIAGGSTVTCGTSGGESHAFEGNTHIFVYGLLGGSTAPDIQDNSSLETKGTGFAAVVGGNVWIDLTDSAEYKPSFSGTTEITIDLSNLSIHGNFEKEIVGGNYTVTEGEKTLFSDSFTSTFIGDDTLSIGGKGYSTHIKITAEEDDIFKLGINGASRRASGGSGLTVFQGNTLVEINGGTYEKAIAGGLRFEESATGAHKSSLKGATEVRLEQGTFWRVVGGSYSKGGEDVSVAPEDATATTEGSSSVTITGGTFNSDTGTAGEGQLDIGFVVGGDYARHDGSVRKRTGNTLVDIQGGTFGSTTGTNKDFHIIGGDDMNFSGTQTASSAIGGTSEVKISGSTTDITALVVGGSYLTDSGQGGSVSVRNTFITVSEGTIKAVGEGSTAHGNLAIVAGNVLVDEGEEAGATGNHRLTVEGTTTVNLTGGTITGSVVGGSYAFNTGDADSASNTLNAKTVEINIRGTNITGDVYGGHYSANEQHTDDLVLGDVTITMTSGTVTGNIVGGSYHASARGGSKSENGNIVLKLTGGSLSGNVYAAGYHNAANVDAAHKTTASVVVELGSGYTFAGDGEHTVSGGYYKAGGAKDTSTVTGGSTLKFTDSSGYTGLDKVKFTDFSEVETAGDVTLAHGMGVSEGSFSKKGDGTLTLTAGLKGSGSEGAYEGKIAVVGGRLVLGTAQSLKGGLEISLVGRTANDADAAWLSTTEAGSLTLGAGESCALTFGLGEEDSTEKWLTVGDYYLASGLADGIAVEQFTGLEDEVKQQILNHANLEAACDYEVFLKVTEGRQLVLSIAAAQDPFSGIAYDKAAENTPGAISENTVVEVSGNVAALNFTDPGNTNLKLVVMGTNGTDWYRLGSTNMTGLASVYFYADEENGKHGVFVTDGACFGGTGAGPTTIYVNGAQLYFSPWEGGTASGAEVTGLTSSFVIGKSSASGVHNNGSTQDLQGAALAFAKAVETTGGLELKADAGIVFYSDNAATGMVKFGDAVRGEGHTLTLKSKGNGGGALTLGQGGVLGQLQSDAVTVSLINGGTLTLQQGGSIGGTLYGDGMAGLAVGAGTLSVGSMNGRLKDLTLGNTAVLDIGGGSLNLTGALSFEMGSRIKLNTSGQQITLTDTALDAVTDGQLTVELSAEFMGEQAKNGTIRLFDFWKEDWDDLFHFVVTGDEGGEKYANLRVDEGLLFWGKVQYLTTELYWSPESSDDTEVVLGSSEDREWSSEEGEEGIFKWVDGKNVHLSSSASEVAVKVAEGGASMQDLSLAGSTYHFSTDVAEEQTVTVSGTLTNGGGGISVGERVLLDVTGSYTGDGSLELSGGTVQFAGETTVKELKLAVLATGTLRLGGDTELVKFTAGNWSSDGAQNATIEIRQKEEAAQDAVTLTIGRGSTEDYVWGNLALGSDGARVNLRKVGENMHTIGMGTVEIHGDLAVEEGTLRFSGLRGNSTLYGVLSGQGTLRLSGGTNLTIAGDGEGNAGSIASLVVEASNGNPTLSLGGDLTFGSIGQISGGTLALQKATGEGIAEVPATVYLLWDSSTAPAEGITWEAFKAKYTAGVTFSEDTGYGKAGANDLIITSDATFEHDFKVKEGSVEIQGTATLGHGLELAAGTSMSFLGTVSGELTKLVLGEEAKLTIRNFSGGVSSELTRLVLGANARLSIEGTEEGSVFTMPSEFAWGAGATLDLNAQVPLALSEAMTVPEGGNQLTIELSPAVLDKVGSGHYQLFSGPAHLSDWEQYFRIEVDMEGVKDSVLYDNFSVDENGFLSWVRTDYEGIYWGAEGNDGSITLGAGDAEWSVLPGRTGTKPWKANEDVHLEAACGTITVTVGEDATMKSLTISPGSAVYNFVAGAGEQGVGRNATVSGELSVGKGTTVSVGANVSLSAGSYSGEGSLRVEGGSVEIREGATIAYATLTDGSMKLNGETSISNAVLEGGSMEINGKASISNATLTGGSLGIVGEATISNITLESGSVEINGGATISNVTMESGSVEISRKATISNATLKSGSMILADGSTISNLLSTSTTDAAPLVSSRGALTIGGGDYTGRLVSGGGLTITGDFTYDSPGTGASEKFDNHADVGALTVDGRFTLNGVVLATALRGSGSVIGQGTLQLTDNGGGAFAGEVGVNLIYRGGAEAFSLSNYTGKSVTMTNGTLSLANGGESMDLTTLAIGESTGRGSLNVEKGSLIVSGSLSWGRLGSYTSELIFSSTGQKLVLSGDGWDGKLDATKGKLTIVLGAGVLGTSADGDITLLEWAGMGDDFDFTRYFEIKLADGVDASSYKDLALSFDGHVLWGERQVPGDLYWDAATGGEDGKLTWGGTEVEWGLKAGGQVHAAWPKGDTAGLNAHIAGVEDGNYTVEMKEDITARNVEFDGGNYVFSGGNGRKLTATGDLTVGANRKTTLDFGNRQVDVGNSLTTGNSSELNINGQLDVGGDLTTGENSELSLGGETTVKGGVTLGDGSSSRVTAGRKLDVGGDLATGENSELSLGGETTVQGEFMLGDGSSATASGALNVGKALVAGNNSKITTGRKLNVGGNLAIGENSELSLGGETTVKGELTLGEGSTAEVIPGGKLDVGSDLTIGENSKLTTKGNASVGGYLVLGSGSSATASGRLDVAGMVEARGGSSVSVNGGGTWGGAQLAQGGSLNVKDVTVQGQLRAEGGKLTVGGKSALGSVEGKLTELEIAQGGDLTVSGGAGLQVENFTWGSGSTLHLGGAFAGTLNFGSMNGNGSNLTLDFSSSFLKHLGDGGNLFADVQGFGDGWNEKFDLTVNGAAPDSYYGDLHIDEKGNLVWNEPVTPEKPIYDSSTDNTGAGAEESGKTEWNKGDKNIYDSVGDYGGVIVDSDTNIDFSDADKESAYGDWDSDGLTVHNLQGSNPDAKLTITGNGRENNKVTLKNRYDANPQYTDDLHYNGGISINNAELHISHEDPTADEGGARWGTTVGGKLDLSKANGLYMDRGVLTLTGDDNDLGRAGVNFDHDKDGHLVISGGSALVSGRITANVGGAVCAPVENRDEHIKLENSGVLQLVGSDEEGTAETTVGAGVVIGGSTGSEIVGVKGAVNMETGSRLRGVHLILEDSKAVLRVGKEPEQTEQIDQQDPETVVDEPAMARAASVDEPEMPLAGEASDLGGVSVYGIQSNGGHLTGRQDIEISVQGWDHVFTGSMGDYDGKMTFNSGLNRQYFTQVTKGSENWDMEVGSQAQVTFNVLNAEGENAGWAMGDVTLRNGSITTLGFTFSSLGIHPSSKTRMSFENFVMEEGAKLTLQAYGGAVPAQDEFVLGDVSGTVNLHATDSVAVAAEGAVEASGDGTAEENGTGNAGGELTLTRDQLLGSAWLHVESAKIVHENGQLKLKMDMAEKNLLEAAVVGTHRNAAEGARALWDLTSPGGSNTRADEALNDPDSDTNKLSGEVYRLMTVGDKAGLANLLAASVGSGYTGYSAALSEDMHRQLASIRNRAASMGGDSPQSPDDSDGALVWHAWINAESSYRELDADSLAPGYRLNGWGGTFGVDADISRNTIVGLALSAMYNDLKCTGAETMSGDMDTMYATAFLRHMRGRWMHTFAISEGLADFKTHRTVMTGSGSYTADADTDGYALGALYEVGYTTPLSESSRSALQYVFNVEVRYNNIDGFTESGSDAGLQVDEMDNLAVTFGAGARIQSMIGENLANRGVVFEARLLVKADAGDRRGEASTRFLNGSYATNLVGAEVGAVGIEAGAGLTIPFGGSRPGSFFIDGSLEFRQGWSSFDASAGLRFTF